jgi:hypothetical protein
VTYIGAGGLREPIATGVQTIDPYLILCGVLDPGGAADDLYGTGVSRD